MPDPCTCTGPLLPVMAWSRSARAWICRGCGGVVDDREDERPVSMPWLDAQARVALAAIERVNPGRKRGTMSAQGARIYAAIKKAADQIWAERQKMYEEEAKALAEMTVSPSDGLLLVAEFAADQAGGENA